MRDKRRGWGSISIFFGCAVGRGISLMLGDKISMDEDRSGNLEVRRGVLVWSSVRRNHIVVVHMNLEWKTKGGRIVRVAVSSSILPLGTKTYCTIPTTPAEGWLMTKNLVR